MLVNPYLPYLGIFFSFWLWIDWCDGLQLLQMATSSDFISEEEVLGANANPDLFSKLICISWVLKIMFVVHLLASWGCWRKILFWRYFQLLYLYCSLVLKNISYLLDAVIFFELVYAHKFLIWLLEENTDFWVDKIQNISLSSKFLHS